MKNKPQPSSRPKKQTKSPLIKTPAVKTTLLGKKKKPTGKTNKKKIGTLDNVNLHKMEKELRETKERLRLLSEAAEEGIAVHYNGLIIEANDALARIFGYELSEMIGMNAKRLASPESWKVIQKHIAAGYDKPYESVGIRKDGTTFTCSLVGKPYKYKGRTVRLSTFHDITERKQAEEKLRREEQRFRALAEQSSDIIVFVNRDGIVTYENPAMEKILGFKPEERIGVNLFNRIHPDDLKFARDMFNKFKVNKSSKDINSPIRQIRLRHQDGSWRTFETSATKLLNDNIVETVIINVRDITERKKAEEALRESEEKYRLIFTYSPLGLLYFNEKGEIVACNDNFVQIIGSSQEKLIGLNMLNLPDKSIVLAVQKALSGSQGLYEGVYSSVTAKKNTSVRCIFAPMNVGGGNIPGGVGIIEDITERKLAEDKLADEHSQLNYILDVTKTRIDIIDSNFNLRYVDDPWQKIYGDPTGRKCYEYFMGRKSPCENCGIPKALDSRQVVITEELLTREGNRCIEVHTIPFQNKEGEWLVAEFNIDISARKEAEEELKRYREHLEELVRERTIKLEAANKELEAFSYSASHDLRAPLRAIDGFSQALLEDCEDKLNIQGKEYLIRIRAAIRRMAELIEDLLQLSKITRTEMNIEKVNLTRIARLVIDELQKSQPQRIVDTRIAERMEETADSKLMRIVLENLLGNAWKFTEKQAKALIEFGCTMKGERKVYFIRDNGVGFDMDYVDKLFAPFQRLHTEEEFPGTGIGLATVRRIIHRHGGKIWTEGQTGKGATFYFSLNEK